MYGYIYKTTCLINGKIYIGQHKAKQFEPEKYIGSGPLFKRAVEKYGKENFKCELIESFDTFEELNSAEEYYIEFYNARDLDIGYNLAKGGWGGSHVPWNKGLTKDSDERVAKYTAERKKTYKGNLGKTNGNYKKMITHIEEILPEFEDYWKTHFTNEVYAYFHISKVALSMCLDILSLDPNDPERKKFLSDRKVKETEETMEAHNSRKRQPIMCVETGQVFKSITEAHIFLGLPTNSKLYPALRDSSKTCEGYHWIKVEE